MTTPDKDGWIAHDGGPNPVPGAVVDVRFHSGRQVDGWRSEDWDWRVIAAYRVREPAPTPVSSSSMTSVCGLWRDANLSRFDRARAHTMEFGSDIKTAVEAVDEEFYRQRMVRLSAEVAPNPLTDALSAVLYRRTERVAFPGQSIVYRNERDCVVIEFFSDDAAADFLAQITPA